MQVILGTKIGMTQIIGEDGVVTPVTILQAGPCTVTQIKTIDTDGYNAVQVGYGQGKNLSKSVAGHVKKAGENINPKVLKEFRVDEIPEGLKLGDTLTVESFKLGDKVLRTAKSGTYTVVYIDSITALQLRTALTIDVYENDTNIGFVKYSPAKYCKIVLGLANDGTVTDDLKRVVSSLYYFSRAAENYNGNG